LKSRLPEGAALRASEVASALGAPPVRHRAEAGAGGAEKAAVGDGEAAARKNSFDDSEDSEGHPEHRLRSSKQSPKT